MNSTVIPLLSQPKDLTGHFEMNISQDEHVDVHQNEPDYVHVDIELAEPLSLVSACPLPAPRKLARAQGIDPTYHPARFLGAIAVSTNDMVDTHLRIIWTDETGATKTQRIPGNFVHLAA